VRVEVAASGFVLSDDAITASSPMKRIKGLLGRPPLRRGEALVLEPASQVHTFGMRGPIDVVFCDRDGIVVHIVRAMRPMRVTKWVRGARRAVEMPANAVPAEVGVGSELVFYEDVSKGQ
jgi:uncharacterized protein